MTSETRAARRRRRSSGWLATLLGASVLVLLGFGAGLLVGASVEDPDLIASVMAGKAAQVDLPPEETIADHLDELAAKANAPAAAAPRPLGGGREAGGTPPVAAGPPPRARGALPQARALPEGSFSVQVGAFREERPARGLVAKLRAAGFKAYVTGSDEGSGQHWRVRVGPVPSRGEADELARRLKRDRGLPTWVVAGEEDSNR